MRNNAVMGRRSKYGGLVVMSSTMVQPTLQMSHAVVVPAISMISGAIQYGLPTTVLLFSCVEMATPKSASFTRPSLVTRMLAPLMSRWMTPCSCR